MELRRQWSFGIGALLAATAGAAVGMATATGKLGQIGEGFLAAVTVWFVFSLLAQTARQWSDYRRLRGVEEDTRQSGRRLEVFWRLAASALLLVVVILNVLRAHGVVPYPESRSLDPVMERGIHMLCLIFIVGFASAIPQTPAARATTSRIRPVWRLVVITIILVFAAVSLFNLGMIHFLVLLAVEGMESARTNWQRYPLERATPGSHPHNEFFVASLGAAVAAVANLVLLPKTLSNWRLRRPSWRRLAGAFLLLSPIVIFPVWAELFGYRRLTPAFDEGPSNLPLRTWCEAALLFGVAGFAMVYATWPGASAGEIAFAPPSESMPSRYLHARRMGAVLLAAALLVSVAYQPIRTWWLDMRQSLSWYDYLDFLPHHPHSQFSAAALVTAIVATFRRPTAAMISLEEPLPLDPARFFAMWLFATVTLIFALACLAIFSFGIWLAPVIRS